MIIGFAGHDAGRGRDRALRREPKRPCPFVHHRSDPADAPTCGAQQVFFFNTHNDNHCHLPDAAKNWKLEPCVIFNAEVVKTDSKEPRDNPRFVVTNMKQGQRWLYEEVYSQRGVVENRIKEFKALDVDRTNCTNFWPINCVC